MGAIKGTGLDLDPDNEKTVRLDTGAGGIPAALNLNFLDLPEDPNLTLAVPEGSSAASPSPAESVSTPQSPVPQLPVPPAALQGTPMAAAAPSGLSQFGTDVPRMTSTGIFGGIRTAGGPGHGRIVKLAVLFLMSFAVAGGVTVLLNSSSDEADEFSVAQPGGRPSESDVGSSAGVPPEDPLAEPSFMDDLYESYLQPVLIGLGLVDEPMPVLPDLPVKKKKKQEIVEEAAPKNDPPPAAMPPDVGNDSQAVPEAASGLALVDKEVTDPYLVIPNTLDKNAIGAANKGRRLMSVSEGQGWQAAIVHKFPYQHYRAVEEMRGLRTRGSESILRSAMVEDPKLWVRMSAAFALVESGESLKVSEVERAVTGRGERATLLASYASRFERSSNLAERYVLKFALPQLPPTGRISVLKALTNAGDSDADLYTIAGSFDESPKVRRWAIAKISRNPAILLRMDEYRSALKTHGLDGRFRSAIAGTRSGEPAGRQLGRGQYQARAFADRPVNPVGGANARLGGTGADALPAGGEAVVEYYGREE